jgi:hypothetical protein
MIERNKSYVVGDRTYFVWQSASMGREPSNCHLSVTRGNITLSFLFNGTESAHISLTTKLTEGSSSCTGVPNSLIEDPETGKAFLGKLETFLAELSIAAAEESNRTVPDEISKIRAKLESQKILSLI